MGRDSDNEMEQIQRGLEAFLEREMAESNGRKEKAGARREPQLYDLEEDWDSWESERGSTRSTGAGSSRTQNGRMKSTGTQNGSARKNGAQATGTRSKQTRNGKARKNGEQATETRNKQTRNSKVRRNGAQATGIRSKQTRNNTVRKNGAQANDIRNNIAQDKKHRKGYGKEPEKKKSKIKRFLVTVAVIFALLVVGLYALVGGAYNRLNYVEVDSVADLPMKENGVVNILLIGNDSRENGDDGRSDAMILLSVSSKTKTVYMTSLLRDMYVEIPGHDNNRLNAAYSFGGAELLMETVEKNFDIPVNRYVQVNFEAFVGLVDAVGGVDLELTQKEIEYVNGYLVEYNILTNRPQGTDDMDTSVSGMVHLNGPQALAYCRNRYLGTDFGRTERQRKVLTEVIKKAPAAMITNGSGLFDALLPNLTTNLTKNECFRLSLMAGKLLTYDMIADSIPQPGTYKDATIRKMAVLEVDFEANRKYLKNKLYGEE